MNSSVFILAGNAGYYNRGSEAITRGTVRILREYFDSPRFLAVSHYKTEEQFQKQCSSETDVDITHLKMCMPKRFESLWFLTKFSDVLYPKARKHIIYKDLKPHLDSARAVLAVGGDNYSLDYGVPKICTDLDDLALNRGKPMVIWCASVGPFNKKPDYERYMLNHLRKVHILARETETIAYLAKNGLTENVYRVADPAFVMEPEEPDIEKYGLDIEPGAVGINLSPLMARFVCGGDIEKWTALAADIVAKIAQLTRQKIYLIPHVMAKASNNDYLFLKKVRSLITKKKDRVVLIPPTLNAPQTKWIISKMAIFTGARTHSTIAALSSYVPTLSLAYSIKAKGVNKDIYDCLDYCIGPDELSPEAVADKMKYLLSESDSVKKHLESRIPQIKGLAISAGDILKKILNEQ